MVSEGENLQAKILLVGTLSLFFLVMLIISFFSSGLTGFALHDLEVSNLVKGHPFRGVVQYDLPDTISASTVVRVEIAGSSRELPLKSVMVTPSVLGSPRKIIEYPVLEVSAIYYPTTDTPDFSTHLESAKIEAESSGTVTNSKGASVGVTQTEKSLSKGTLGKDSRGRSISSESSGTVTNSKGASVGVTQTEKSLSKGTLGKDSRGRSISSESFGGSFSTIGKVISELQLDDPRWKTVNLDSTNPGRISAESGAGLVVTYVSSDDRPVPLNLVDIYYDEEESAFMITTDYSIESTVYEPTFQGPVALDLSRFGFQVPNTVNLPVRVSIIEDSKIISETYQNYPVSNRTDTGSDPSLVPIIANSSSGTQTCEYACTPFGACFYGSSQLQGLATSLSTTRFNSYVQAYMTRTCSCVDGSSEPIVETQSCTIGILDVNPDVNAPIQSSPKTIDYPSPSVEVITLQQNGKGRISPSNSPSTSGSSRSSNNRDAIRGTQSVAEWSRTITQTSRDIAFQGALKSELEENSRVQISYAGEKHSVGVRTIALDSAGKRYIDVEVSSEPQQGRLYEDQQEPFDLDGDGFFDVGVTFSGYTNNQAEILIEPLKGDGPLQLSPGEKGIQVNNKDLKFPVAYVTLRGEYPQRLTIILVQSELQLPSHCSNLIEDFDEEGVDCGPTCRTCYKDHPFYARIISVMAVFLLGLTCLFIFRRR